MRILHTVRRYAPETGGSEEVVRKLSEYLVSFGHEVTVATSASTRRKDGSFGGVNVIGFNCSGNSALGIKGESSRYLDFVRGGSFDVMMNYSAHVWTTDLLLPLLETLKAKTVLVPLGYYPIDDPSYAQYFRSLHSFLPAYDKVVYLSDTGADWKFGQEARLTNGVIIPNGADIGDFDRQPKGKFRERYGLEDKFIVLNVSNHSLLKNHKFFWKVTKGMDPRSVVSVMIGNAFHPFPLKWVSECYPRCRFQGMRPGAMILEGLPRDQVIQSFLDADVFLFGSRAEASPLVMFESFLSRTLFVSTDIGNVREFDDIACVVRDEHEARDRIQDMRVHASEFEGRLQKGEDRIRKSLNWEAIARRYEELYKNLVRGSVQ